jgi:hypothetical protein
MKGKFIKCDYCKKEVYKYPREIKRGLKHFFCSLKCHGLLYRGISVSPGTQFKKGMIPWSKGKKIDRPRHSGDFVRGFTPWNKGMKYPRRKIKIKFDKVANRTLVGKICNICCKLFWIYRKERKFCSRECFGKNYTISHSVARQCKCCGKSYSVLNSYGGKKYFCSLACAKKYLIKDRHPSWKGGIKKDKDRRKSFEGSQWRKAVFERDNYTCVLCMVRGGRLEADHIKPYSMFPELRYEINNGRTLCSSCHRKTPTYGSKARRFK